MKKIKLNKKNIIIFSIILLIIIVIIATIIILNKDKQETEEENNEQIEVEEYESEIDITNTENSEIREDGMKVNTSSKIAEGIEFNDVFIKDITIESSGDMAVFNATVENNLGKDIEEYIIYITFWNSDGEEIETVETLFPSIPDGETGFISASTPKDIATAYEITIERDTK